MVFLWACSLPVLLILNSIHEILPHLNLLLTRSRGKPPAKSSSMQIIASVKVALLMLFGLLFIRDFQEAKFLLFFHPTHQEKFYKTILCKMNRLHIQICGKRLRPCHPEALSRHCSAFPSPLKSINSLTGKPSSDSRPPNVFVEETIFLCWAHCCRCKVCKGYQRKVVTCPEWRAALPSFTATGSGAAITVWNCIACY